MGIYLILPTYNSDRKIADACAAVPSVRVTKALEMH
jgi:hypothetical protein